REELGVDPHELPSPLLAGAASLIAFSLGAFLPLFPYVVGARHLLISLIVAGIALLAGGAAVGRLTGRPIGRSGLRQLLLGALAVAVTYGIGDLIGASAG
ncbi:MAG TPA: VIT1/CCC1 transporter family protein, partial [Mycobacteriales bacterium]|nr:VIT1/CCC1 transporter family protein [Mycobacteriales bacterium]